MGEHALLSPSSAHRWIRCTPSAVLETEFEGRSSPAAAEGTAAHALCEHKLKRLLHRRSKRPVSSYDSDEMEEYTDAYVEFVSELLEKEKQNCKDPLVQVEERLDLSRYVPGAFGTADCLIVADGTLHVIDMKYGLGVLVSAEDNPQLKCYGVAALSIYESLYDIKDVSLSIFQPRRENVSTWTISAKDLKLWAENELKPKAQLAFKGEGDYSPGEWCQFCRAAVKCRARAKEKLLIAEEEFRLPPLLTDDEIEAVLPKLTDIIKWANDIGSYALEMSVSHGKEWTGYKVVEGRSVRRYSDETAVAEMAKKNGYTDIYKKSLITMTEMQKLMGKKKFEELLGSLITKPPGKPTLVPVTDKRPAMNVSNAKTDFITEE